MLCLRALGFGVIVWAGNRKRCANRVNNMLVISGISVLSLCQYVHESEASPPR